MNGSKSVDEEKAQRRQEIATRVASIPPDERIVLDAQIASHLTQLVAWKQSGVVLGYVAMEDEVDLSPVFSAALKAGKHLALPRIDSGQPGAPMEFRVVSGDSTVRQNWTRVVRNLEQHPFGFLQPKVDMLPVELIDHSTLVVVPGRGFDRKGNRLGRGMGFYDAFLRGLSSSVATVAVGYSVQLLMSVPTDTEDVPVSTVVTDTETCFCRR